ncbi:MAG: hypothetical protein J4N97_10855 [Chloroflexi bacterium]|nr:hypothetical protein [Chloroflexota bacterium]
MVRIRKISTAMIAVALSLIALLVSACGSGSRVAAPSNDNEIPVEVVIVEVTTEPEATRERNLFVPEPTSTPERSAIVVETSTRLVLSTPDPESTPTPPDPTRREPTSNFTVHDLDVEPLVGSVFETLLSKMPDNEVTRAYTRMGDVAGVIDALGLSPLAQDESGEEILNIRARLETDDFYPPWWQWPIEARDYAGSYNWYPDLAFNGNSVEQFAHSNSQFRFFGGERPFTSYDVALGDFSGSATLAAIAACDCEQPEIREYSGVEYYAWGEGDGIGELRERHKRPMFDHIGRGPHLLVLDGEAYYSIRDGVIDEHVDVIQGKKSSLADVEDIVIAVQLVSSLGLTSEIVVRDFGFTLKQTFEGLRGQESEEEIVGGVPLLLPMELVATSVGYDGNRMFTGLAILHDSSSSAEENVERLLARFEVAVSTSYLAKPERTWAYLTDRIEIQTSDRFLIARLYFTERRTARLLEFSNNLLVQEDQNDGRRRND